MVFNIFVLGNSIFAVTVMFYISTSVTAGLFLQIAKKWPSLMSNWTDVDNAMTGYRFPRNMKKKMVVVTYTIITAASREWEYY